MGSIAKGKQADLVVSGNPAQKIADIEKVEIVFQEGIGYDPAKLVQPIQGQVESVSTAGGATTQQRICLDQW